MNYDTGQQARHIAELAWERLLAKPCASHDAPAGALCWDNPMRAVCGTRAAAATSEARR